MRKLFVAILVVLGLVDCGMSTTIKAATNDVNNQFGIKIDGKFDDWKQFKKTPIQNDWPTDVVKGEVLLADRKNIYYYITMSLSGKDNYPMQVNDYELIVGNVRSVIYIKEADNIPANGSKKVLLQNTSHGKNLTHSPAIIHRYVKNGKEYAKMECRIPFSDLGLSPTTEQKITMYTPLLGNQTVTTEGGSTGPIILAVIGLVIASLAVFGITKRKKSN